MTTVLLVAAFFAAAAIGIAIGIKSSRKAIGIALLVLFAFWLGVMIQTEHLKEFVCGDCQSVMSVH